MCKTTNQWYSGCHLIAVALFVTMASLASAESPSPEIHLDPLTIEGPPYSVWVSTQTECCPKVVELRVRKEGWDEERTLEMSGRIQTLQKLQPVIEPRLLVVGELRYGGTNLWIANLETLEQEAEIWNYGYGVSPSGRFLAYQTHYPRMALPNARRSIFLLYDLSLPPEDNRPGPPSDWPEPNLGTPIFPEENVEEGSWSIFESELSYGLVSPFLWSKDERVLVFLVGGGVEPDDRGNFIVRLGLTADGMVEAIRQERLSLENVDAPLRTVTEERLREEPLLLFTETLKWSEERGKDWVVAEPSAGSQLGPRIWIRIP